MLSIAHDNSNKEYDGYKSRMRHQAWGTEYFNGILYMI